MAADVLTTFIARASATMILTLVSQNTQVSVSARVDPVSCNSCFNIKTIFSGIGILIIIIRRL